MSDQQPINVLVVDDDMFVRHALGDFISTSSALRLVGAVENGELAVSLVAEQPVDVVVMDIQMPVLDGVSAARIIRERHPSTRVLMLTSFDEDESVQAAMACGASGFLLKSTSPQGLTDAIRAVHGGASVMSPEPMRRFTRPNPPKLPTRVPLSESEREVLQLLCQGQSNAEIASALYLSEST